MRLKESGRPLSKIEMMQNEWDRLKWQLMQNEWDGGRKSYIVSPLFMQAHY